MARSDIVVPGEDLQQAAEAMRRAQCVRELSLLYAATHADGIGGGSLGRSHCGDLSLDMRVRRSGPVQSLRESPRRYFSIV